MLDNPATPDAASVRVLLDDLRALAERFKESQDAYELAQRAIGALEECLLRLKQGEPKS